ncbi:cellulose binding domain-containing protein [Glycomyces albidus]|uniref:Cellulose-binding protein n=1 Tax=Glycomyces albidus TaxID=2656774 RepID=A0A6L5GAL2_9ACTN|nr:cellulose binding domain-containing protein [Glycomyces albidus]MQM26616.1 cellulose-binding protein [Glycomyces albidus]
MKPLRTGARLALVAAALAALVTAGALTAAADPAASPAQAASTAGCGRAPGLTSGTHTIQSGGKSRSFILDIPADYDRDHPYRLVFGFHWWGGTAQNVATGENVQTGTYAYYGLKRLAGGSTIFVAPQGLDNAWANNGGEDVAFTDAMLDVIEGALCIDTDQRFSVGFSYGGAMSYSLACSRPDVFRAIAPYGSPGFVSGCSGGTEPVAVFAAHGTTDNFTDGISQRDRFVANNGCTPQTTPSPPRGSRTHITTEFAGCSEDHPVVWASFDEGHIQAPRDGASGDGANSWLPGETWAFFNRFASDPPEETTSPDDTTSPGETTSPPPTGSGCSAEIDVVNDWGSGWQGNLLVTAGSGAVSGWTVTWTWPGGQRISSHWNADVTTSGSTVTAADVGWNGSVRAGQTISAWGFVATGSAATPAVTCTAAVREAAQGHRSVRIHQCAPRPAGSVSRAASPALASAVAYSTGAR